MVSNKFYQNLTKTAFRKSRAKTELENYYNYF